MEQQPKDLINNASQWTSAALDEGPDKARDISSYYLKNLNGILKSHPALGSEVTPLIGRIKGIQRSIKSYQQIKWIRLGNGCLGIGPKPEEQTIRDLAMHGNVQLISFLTEEESIDSCRVAKETKLKCRRFDLPEDQLPKKQQHHDLVKLYVKMMSAIHQGKCLYLNCSDGIFRSGMMAYSFIQFVGYPPKKAKKMLKEMSKDAFKEMGRQRQEWADQTTPELIELKKTRFLS